MKTEEELDIGVANFAVDIQKSTWKNAPKIKTRSCRNNYPREIRKSTVEERKT